MSNFNSIKIWHFRDFSIRFFFLQNVLFFGKLNAENTLSSQQGVW